MNVYSYTFRRIRQVTKSSAPSALIWRRLRDPDYRALPWAVSTFQISIKVDNIAISMR